jgi:hypothetical protein
VDFLHWQRGSGLVSGAVTADGDANGDFKVDDLDLITWHMQYGAALEGLPEISLVPEPASVWLLVLGICLGQRRSRCGTLPRSN